MSGGGRTRRTHYDPPVSPRPPQGDPGGPGGANPCEVLTDTAVLQSPVLTQLATIHVNDLLPIGIRTVGGTETLVAVNQNDEVVGSFVTGLFNEFLDCIRGGHTYVATVLFLEGAECRVRVSHA